MTTLLLIRHATCDPVGVRLAGRAPGISLNAAGRAQAESLARRLSGVSLTAVYSSPLERARETAEAIASPRGLGVELVEGLIEWDFGAWTGCTLAELEPDPTWHAFNRVRSATRPPGGEHVLELQARVVAALDRIVAIHPEARVAVVSHADVLRSAVAHHLGVPIDLAHRLEFAPASVTVLARQPWGPLLLRLNDCGDLGDLPE